MAYDKNVWQCGDEITAEKLNHIEDGIENAGGGDAGFECAETVTDIFEETVTTETDGAALLYANQINSDVIRVTFDGVDYTATKMTLSGSTVYNVYGGYDIANDAPDFSEYPFAILSPTTLPQNTSLRASGGGGSTSNYIIAETAGEHTVKVAAVLETIETTPCFEKAVASVAKSGFFINVSDYGVDSTSDKDFDEIVAAYNEGQALYVKIKARNALQEYTLPLMKMSKMDESHILGFSFYGIYDVYEDGDVLHVSLIEATCKNMMTFSWEVVRYDKDL